ncbi:flagellar protein flil [Plakobranchus ocellatus]|uniref:Flagellar protein flil n=1 Tax=Plakobranchus ocellatus TaxID=259542 RepID=A0AAV4D3T8_9GAST|nr:flagellar protein flil [Plakobranchus ocellatus]
MNFFKNPQTQLLSGNLTFFPTPHHIYHIELSEDILRLCRRLSLAEICYGEENTTPHEPLPPFLQKPSSFTPNAGRDPALDAYIKVVTKDLITCQPGKSFPNIRTEEKRALKELKNNADIIIIIKPADKGGAVVHLNTTDHIAECTRQLSDTKYYQKLNSDPTKKFNKRISDILELGVSSGEIVFETANASLFPTPSPGDFIFSRRSTKKGIQGGL